MLLSDSNLHKAISRIHQRSERQENPEKLLGTYVDVGLLPQINNNNHQILYGRRGTGKTHVLKVLETELQEDSSNTVAYIDCRTLGSSQQFSDTSLPIGHRCLSLFRDIMMAIHFKLFEHIVNYPTGNSSQAWQANDDFLNSLSPAKTYLEKSVTTDISAGEAGKANASMSVAPTTSKFEAGLSQEATKKSTSYDVSTEDKVFFPALHSNLEKTLSFGETRLYILLDEWASLPTDIQPYLAEFLKRGVLPVQKATVKIASLEYRSQFFASTEHGIIGFELGADIATGLDLDEYYVFDHTPTRVANIYADVLYRHLDSELPADYLETQLKIADGNRLISKMFTEKKTFEELARASEGVVRDLINIFSTAFFNAHRRGRDKIDHLAITQAAQKWFEQDKAQALSEPLHVLLTRIISEVIGSRKARSFLLPRRLEKHEAIQGLFDARVLHLVKRGYADANNPGVRFNIYTLDYGTYVDLMGTSRQPELGFEAESVEPTSEIIVPFDDKRSIRRIVLNEKTLVGANE